MQQPRVPAQGFANEQQKPSNLSRSPPLSRGSGAVVESPLLDPLLLHQEAQGWLDAHIQRKWLQLLWGLPHPVHRSLEQSVPVLPRFLACTTLQEATGQQRPLFKAEQRQDLEHHLREKMVHRKWGLPRRIQRALRWPLSLELPSAAPEAQWERPPLKGWSATRQCNPATTWTTPARTMAADGSWSLPKAAPGAELAKEPSPLSARPLVMQQEALLGAEREQQGGDCPQEGLPFFKLSCSQSPPGSIQAAPFDGLWSTPEVKGLSRWNRQDWERQLLHRDMLCMIGEASSPGSLSFAKATSLKRKPAIGMKKQKLEVSPLGVSEVTDDLGWLLQAGQGGASRMTFVPAEKRVSGAPERSSVAFYLQEQPTFQQEGPRTLQLSKWLERGQKQVDSTESQELRASPGPQTMDPRQLLLPLVGRDLGLLHQESPGPAGRASCALGQEDAREPQSMSTLEDPSRRPNLARTRSRVTVKGEGLGSQAGSFPEGKGTSLTHSGAGPGDEGSKAHRLTDDRKRYFEFHLREKLLHQRWGVPRRVQEVLLQPTRP
nr:zinc finger protein 512 isoform X1 [Pogona vitticeps]XP_020663935.1 zinc finger protein 512 isoform X1 [Pogona vitticeps]